MCTGLAVDWAPSEFRGFLLGAASAAGLGLGKCIHAYYLNKLAL